MFHQNSIINPTLKSSMLRLIKAFPAAGQSCCADLKQNKKGAFQTDLNIPLSADGENALEGPQSV